MYALGSHWRLWAGAPLYARHTGYRLRDHTVRTAGSPTFSLSLFLLVAATPFGLDTTHALSCPGTHSHLLYSAAVVLSCGTWFVSLVCLSRVAFVTAWLCECSGSQWRYFCTWLPSYRIRLVLSYRFVIHLVLFSTLLPRWYRAPEVMLTREHYTSALDIWGGECICGQACCPRPVDLCVCLEGAAFNPSSSHFLLLLPFFSQLAVSLQSCSTACGDTSRATTMTQ